MMRALTPQAVPPQDRESRKAVVFVMEASNGIPRYQFRQVTYTTKVRWLLDVEANGRIVVRRKRVTETEEERGRYWLSQRSFVLYGVLAVEVE
jgi:hypothetical protein